MDAAVAAQCAALRREAGRCWSAIVAAHVASEVGSLLKLEQLKNAPVLYVPKSVANHLNDIAKDHPQRALELAARWYAEGGEDALDCAAGAADAGQTGQPGGACAAGV